MPMFIGASTKLTQRPISRARSFLFLTAASCDLYGSSGLVPAASIAAVSM